jgi:hypothetical protein
MTPAANLPQVPPVTDTGGIPLGCEYLCKFSQKFEMALLGYSGVWGKLIHEKNLKWKISWHCPFKGVLVYVTIDIDFWSDIFGKT